MPAVTTAWSRKYAACVVCGTTDHPHRGKGRCEKCRDRKANPVSVRARNERYRSNNREAIKARQTRWYAENKDKQLRNAKAHHRRKATLAAMRFPGALISIRLADHWFRGIAARPPYRIEGDSAWFFDLRVDDTGETLCEIPIRFESVKVVKP